MKVKVEISPIPDGKYVIRILDGYYKNNFISHPTGTLYDGTAIQWLTEENAIKWANEAGYKVLGN